MTDSAKMNSTASPTAWRILCLVAQHILASKSPRGSITTKSRKEIPMTSGGRVAKGSRMLVEMLGVLLVAGILASTPAQAQIPDSVLPFLDLKCYGITDPDGGPLPPLNVTLHLDHLNPLFQQVGIPPEDIVLLDPFQLCVPVAKNGVNPPPDALQYIQYIDLKCYNIQTDTTPLGLGLLLTHLNPVLQQFPREFVIVQDPQKLCVPVAKSASDGTPALPPPAILQSIQFIDQKGYGITNSDGFPLPPLNFPIHLDHLNPVFLTAGAGVPPEDVLMDVPQQLTVPIAKNGQFPPPVDLRVISQIDEKCYALLDPATGGPLPPLGLPQLLWHLNPVLQTLPPEQVLIQEPQQLCVPVAKSLPGTTSAAR